MLSAESVPILKSLFKVDNYATVRTAVEIWTATQPQPQPQPQVLRFAVCVVLRFLYRQTLGNCVQYEILWFIKENESLNVWDLTVYSTLYIFFQNMSILTENSSLKVSWWKPIFLRLPKSFHLVLDITFMPNFQSVIKVLEGFQNYGLGILFHWDSIFFAFGGKSSENLQMKAFHEEN